MGDTKATRFDFLQIIALLMLLCFGSCKKQDNQEDKAMLNPPVRTYIVTARIDKKGTNSNSEGTAVLKGEYDEATKLLSYKLEYSALVPELITFRNGPKGSVGVLIKELYRNSGKAISLPLSGSLLLSPLQERNLLKGQWFVSINTLELTPEISGYLTLKQK
ncbi:MAG: hypothetical protein P0Y49_10470 [Candidatus Pedobacter colombiensis]|uniref:CHRD domain-containing protein n=1 Tax=Candidatus Pedobacter colombiensis TaxID=3121371 RepID=A0AAJ5WBI1_9SPHI|nr:hypothetical protein [Pedobacter sp.]WEK21561.1 MAG: hypothetical protein P0Y49_10470 [Pedobacter sp.]